MHILKYKFKKKKKIIPQLEQKGKLKRVGKRSVTVLHIKFEIILQFQI